jgi:hypothetical protein
MRFFVLSLLVFFFGISVVFGRLSPDVILLKERCALVTLKTLDHCGNYQILVNKMHFLTQKVIVSLEKKLSLPQDREKTLDRFVRILREKMAGFEDKNRLFLYSLVTFPLEHYLIDLNPKYCTLPAQKNLCKEKITLCPGACQMWYEDEILLPNKEMIAKNSDFCSDSDEGFDPYSAGNLSGTWLFWSWLDQCFWDKLMEYYCASDGAIWILVSCDFGCFAWACKTNE